MAMEKEFNSKDVVIVSDPVGDRNVYPVGFRYILGTTIYTVIGTFRADNTEMRRMVTGSGEIQEVTVATMNKDAQDPTFKQLESKDTPFGE